MWPLDIRNPLWVCNATGDYDRTDLNDYRQMRRESSETSVRRLRCPLQIFKPPERRGEWLEGWGGAGCRVKGRVSCARLIGGAAAALPTARTADTSIPAGCADPARRAAAETASVRLRFDEIQEEPLRRLTARLDLISFGAPGDDFFWRALYWDMISLIANNRSFSCLWDEYWRHVSWIKLYVLLHFLIFLLIN